MNFVRRSLGAVALTFCGMLSLHADVNQIVQPVRDVVVNADNLSQSVTNFKNALKQVLANTIQASLIDQENIKRCNVGNSDVITGKAQELIDASKDANQVTTGAGFDTVEIIEVKEALAQFNNAFGDQKVRGLIRKLPKLEDNHDSVVNYMNAVKATVDQKDLITVLNIAKKCNGADVAALLKLRDELKVGKDAAKIVGTVNEKNVNAYIAKFTKQMAKIATMTVAQAGHAHKYTLAQARIVARAAREAGLDVNAFDAQIAQAKADLKARFVAANQEIVDRQAAALVKKAQPGLMSKGLSWAKSWFGGKKGGNEVGDIEAPAVNDFAQVIEALNNLVVREDNKVAVLQALVGQVAAIENTVSTGNYDADLQRPNLVEVIRLINNKFKQAFMDLTAVNDYINAGHDADKNTIKLAAQKIRLIIVVRNDVEAVIGEQLAEFIELKKLSNDIYRQLD